MAARRHNVVGNDEACRKFIDGVKRLKTELGPDGLGTYDAFAVWHYTAMHKPTPPGHAGGRNAAHKGPVFLPWHRFFLIVLEQNLQRVLGDSSFGIPYWDWAADGELPPEEQRSAPIWSDDCMGPDGAPVSSGEFAFSEADPTAWRIRVEAQETGKLVRTNRGLERLFGEAGSLPTRSQVRDVLQMIPYDEEEWDSASQSFRNALEGWLYLGKPQRLHNAVHAWVGKDMRRMTSPNDPVFYLHHANVDRIWTAWQTLHPNTPYLPDSSASEALEGHRLDDPLVSPFPDSPSPRQVLDVRDIYGYDTLDDLVAW
jgi:tyrosinase